MKGKVYVIYSESSGLAYYGSTIQTLEERLKEHESARRCFDNGTARYVYSFKVLDCGDAKIELVKEIEYDFDYELTNLEALYIRNYPCVNHTIPNRTPAEYRHDNREAIIKHYHDNREAILKQKKQYYSDNQEAKLKKANQYYQINREQINKKQKVKHTCECGGKYTNASKAKHSKTNRHQQFLSQTPISDAL